MQLSENTERLISVVVCTFNRAGLLSDVLKTLSEQKLETSCYEVIVVDNNSRDNTRYISETFCRDYRHEIHPHLCMD